MTLRVNCRNTSVVLYLAVCLALYVSTSKLTAQDQSATRLAPSTMKTLGMVDPRYVSFNVEMVEVTGGRFWKPYKAAPDQPENAQGPLSQTQELAGLSGMFRYRPPIDLANPRLRTLARALAPSYMRVSGTWQNSTYFQNDDLPALKQPPEGFRGVLTRAQWKGVLDFSRAVDAQLVTSVAVSPGTRDAQGVWTPAQAKALLDYTKSLGGSIAATEFMNEPTIPDAGNAPKGYDAAAFAHDAKLFEAFLRKESPKTVYLGPGSTAEGAPLMPSSRRMQMRMIASEDMLKETGPLFDAFSYHYYGAISRRCTGSLTVDQALSADWLDRTDTVEAFYAALRDKYLAGKPMWLTETAEAACGGDELAGQFVDTFRFVNQLGSLAQKGVKTVMHNTLAASDYSLVNEDTLQPKPNYWAALLWKRTMGTVVLDPAATKEQNLRIYSHCMAGHKGGVAVAALNLDKQQERVLEIPLAGERLTLTAPSLTSTTVQLNGAELQAGPDGSVPATKGEPTKAGTVRIAPLSITFLTFPTAANKSCM